MASNGRHRSGHPLGRAAIGALLRTPRLLTVAQTSKVMVLPPKRCGDFAVSGEALAGVCGVTASGTEQREVGDRRRVALPHDVLVPKPVAQA